MASVAAMAGRIERYGTAAGEFDGECHRSLGISGKIKPKLTRMGQ
jgi:hypothetical protein